jgi:dTDP-4-dehydrorhamnose 3,5-epimerase
VTGVSTAEYFSGAATPVAPRPASSVLDLTKIESTGFIPVDADEMLVNYVRLETRESHQTASR